MNGSIRRIWAQAQQFAERRSVEELRRTMLLGDGAYRAFDVANAAMRAVLPRHPLHQNEAMAPILLVGAGRSGTTLLRRIVSGHPEVHLPPESRMAQAIRVYRRNADLAWSDLVAVTLGAFVFNYQFTSFKMDVSRLAAELGQLPRRQRSLAAILDKIYSRHATQVGKPGARWGDKTPSNSRFLPRIHSTFPKAQVIHILRDGGDVIPSAVRAGFGIDLTHSALRWRREATSAATWCEAHPNQSLTIRYEALVSDPEAVAREISSFLRIPYAAEMLEATDSTRDIAHQRHLKNVGDPIVASSIGKGRAGLDASTRAELGPLVNDALVRFGYRVL